MSALSADELRGLLADYGAASLPDEAIRQVQVYLDTFSVWSKRINLTTIRDPAQVVQRHFGEGFALASVLPECTTLLDLGSGAGFPGIPIALARPETAVMLAEAQGKKAAFLNEVTARMGLETEVWSRRAEELIGLRKFDVVALRAVDTMDGALATASRLLIPGGSLAFFVSSTQDVTLPLAPWAAIDRAVLPGCAGHAVLARLP